MKVAHGSGSGNRNHCVHLRLVKQIQEIRRESFFQFSFEDTASEDCLQAMQNYPRLALFKGTQPRSEKGLQSCLFHVRAVHLGTKLHVSFTLILTKAPYGLPVILWGDIWLLFGETLIRESVPFVMWQITFFISDVQVHEPCWGFCHLPLKEDRSQVS